MLTFLSRILLSSFFTISLFNFIPLRAEETRTEAAAKHPPDSYHEVTPALTLYSGDALRGFIMGGISYTYHFNREFWFGADFFAGTLNIDRVNGARLKRDHKYLCFDGVFYWNLPVRLGAATPSDSGLAGDLYTSFGAGMLWLGPNKEPVGIFGGGMIIHTPIKWLSVRFDLKGLFFNLDNATGTDFNADLAFNLGPSFLF